MNKSETWPTAQKVCRDDGGDLMCFASSLELDYWKIHCNECWSGYNRLNGKYDIQLRNLLSMKICMTYEKILKMGNK